MSAPVPPGGPLEPLARRAEDLCAGAVDTLEIAAGLEADGINDEIAGRYGYSDVFELAADLHDRTERRPQATAAPPNPWRAQAWRHLLRGMLFGLPGLAYAAALPAVTAPGPGPGAVLVLSLLLSWPVSQGAAYLAYVRIGQGDRQAAARVLRRGLLSAGLLLVPVIALAGIALGAGGAATALAVAQCVYLLAATVALVSGAELWLLAALLPGAAVSTVQLAAGDPAGPAGWIAWSVTIAATVGLAAARTTPGKPRGRVLSYRDVVAALPHAIFGLFAGGLLTIATVAAPLGGSSPARATTAAVLALSLSMGVAEWILVHYRRAVHGLLLSRGSVLDFAFAARAALAAAVAGYTLALTTLTATIMWVAGVPGAPATPWVAGGYICLGGALFVALLLQSCGRTRAVLVGCGAALAAEVVAVTAEPGPAQLTSRFTITAALFGALSIFAFVVLGRATSHR